VKRDTYFVPDSDHSVYFRNNVSSFRMEGSTIDQWIEKLLPMFNGKYTLGELTEGLPEPYRNRVYDIAEALYRNGYVRDVSRDRPHQLTDAILQQYASQIEYLDSFLDSSAYRFQLFRQSTVLAIGTGSFLISLVSALLEAGLPKFHVLISDTGETNVQRLAELEEHARESDAEVAIRLITQEQEREPDWPRIVQPFDAVLFVSREGNIEACRALQHICRDEKKLFIPAMVIRQVGTAGPVFHPETAGSWESAWRRLHGAAVFKDEQRHTSSSTAEAILANMIVFEFFKQVTGVTQVVQQPSMYLLNLETLEGEWHSFLPHPLAEKGVKASWVDHPDLLLKKCSGSGEQAELLAFFSLLTSPETGIFHAWEQGDFKQLPLAQCLVQVADPLSAGPAQLLPEVICTGLTHEDVRREAGLTGIEMYLAQLKNYLLKTLPELKEGRRMIEPQEFVGFGVGETPAEGFGRALQHCLNHELRCQWDSLKRASASYRVSRVQLKAIEDRRSQFYLQALTTLQGEPIIGIGEPVCGFPVIWVGTKRGWYGSAGLDTTVALRNAVQHALSREQNKAANIKSLALEVTSVTLDEQDEHRLLFPAYEENPEGAHDVLHSAIRILKQHSKRLLVFEVEAEPFLKEKLQGMFGVLLREEEAE
jgi:putative thiazole-containing bacteriocin maturation protein